VAIKICIDAVEGLKAIHSHRPEILHRDLKSLNLLVFFQISSLKIFNWNSVELFAGIFGNSVLF
jgi:serine/threonine protein kinase